MPIQNLRIGTVALFREEAILNFTFMELKIKERARLLSFYLFVPFKWCNKAVSWETNLFKFHVVCYYSLTHTSLGLRRHRILIWIAGASGC